MPIYQEDRIWTTRGTALLVTKSEQICRTGYVVRIVLELRAGLFGMLPSTYPPMWKGEAMGETENRETMERGAARDLHNPQDLGRLGEWLANRFLEDQGYAIVERNHRTPYGEADLICRDANETVLVEVKTRMGRQAHPEEAVDRRKMLRYRNIMLDYLKKHPDVENVRFDVVAVNVTSAHSASIRQLVGLCVWEG